MLVVENRSGKRAATYRDLGILIAYLATRGDQRRATFYRRVLGSRMTCASVCKKVGL